MLVEGRAQRQAARAVKRREAQDGWNEEADGEEAEDADAILADIPVDNAANFPSLECLALPYEHYNRGGDECGEVSVWMMAQLRRSYEYEVAAEWEAECTTL